MKLRGAGRLRRMARQINALIWPPPLILLYHRVADLTTDPFLLSVRRENFRRHLEILRRDLRPISLASLLEAIRTRRVPHRAVVVTFDDGYLDNLIIAKPLLELYEIPATVFVSSGYVGGQHEFWWDELERLLLMPGVVPRKLEMEIAGQRHVFDFGENWQYSHADASRHQEWNTTVKDLPTTRHIVYIALHRLLLKTTVAERERVLAAIRKWAGKEPKGRPSHLALSPDEVRQLSKNSLVEIGAHTVHHPRLASLSVDQQSAEIRDSKAALEEMIGISVNSFSYPFGGPDDYTSATIDAVGRAGFECACTAFPLFGRRGGDRFQLPRFMVLDWNGEEFSRQIRECRSMSGWLTA